MDMEYKKTEYHNIDIDMLPITPVTDYEGKDFLIAISLPKKKLI